MTEEEKLAEEYVKSVIDVNAFDWKIVREICLAFLAGLEAGKNMAETNLATVAYMQGAERYEPKWHKVTDGDLPNTEREVLVFMLGSYYLGYYNQKDSSWHFEDFDEESEQVDAWCEIPQFKDKE